MRQGDHDPDSYSDIEVQHVMLTADVTPDGGDDAFQLVAEYEVVNENGIQQDQLAELMYSEFTLGITERDFSGTTPSGPGSCDALATVGINLDQTTADLTDGNAENTFIQVADMGEANVTLNGDMTDDPGVLHAVHDGISGSFEDAVNGLGGGADGGTGSPISRVNWREVAGHGPIVDRTDDLTVTVDGAVSGEINPVRLTPVARLYWNPIQVEDARPRLGF